VARSFDSVRGDFDKANRARQMLDEAVTSYHAAIVVRQEGRSETEREKAHDALDAFFDALAAGHRELSREQG